MLQKVTRLDSVPTAEETVLTTEVPTKESRLYTLLVGRQKRYATSSNVQMTSFVNVCGVKSAEKRMLV